MNRRQRKKRYKKHHGHNPVQGTKLSHIEQRMVRELIWKIDNLAGYRQYKTVQDAIRSLSMPEFEKFLKRQKRACRAIALIIRGKGA